jgi:hypothetical protein
MNMILFVFFLFVCVASIGYMSEKGEVTDRLISAMQGEDNDQVTNSVFTTQNNSNDTEDLQTLDIEAYNQASGVQGPASGKSKSNTVKPQTSKAKKKSVLGSRKVEDLYQKKKGAVGFCNVLFDRLGDGLTTIAQKHGSYASVPLSLIAKNLYFQVLDPSYQNDPAGKVYFRDKNMDKLEYESSHDFFTEYCRTHPVQGRDLEEFINFYHPDEVYAINTLSSKYDLLQYNPAVESEQEIAKAGIVSSFFANTAGAVNVQKKTVKEKTHEKQRISLRKASWKKVAQTKKEKLALAEERNQKIGFRSLVSSYQTTPRFNPLTGDTESTVRNPMTDEVSAVTVSSNKKE